jgi:prepilin-type N-terminal cleavage/methylation domain-containing protein
MNTKKAFTLIELMIAITIIVILTMASYAPYTYYQNKAKLKVTSREISQLLYEARNMAIN